MSVSALSCLSSDQSKKQPVLEEKGLDEAHGLLSQDLVRSCGVFLRQGGTDEDGISLQTL